MKMYHKDSEGSVDVHASQIENMKNQGWTEKSNVKPKPTYKPTPKEVQE